MKPHAVKRTRARLLSLDELADLTRLPAVRIQGFVNRGLYRGLRRAGKFHPLTLPVTEVMLEVGHYLDTGALTRDEALHLLGSMRPSVRQAFGLAILGRPVNLDVKFKSGKTVRFQGAARAAKLFEQLVLAS